MIDENWLIRFWRPAMAWQYLLVCLFDFMIAPILTGIFFYLTKGTYVPWVPITMSEGGFYHLSMAAIVGVSAWTRGQEKMKQLDMYGNTTTISSTSTTSTPVK